MRHIRRTIGFEISVKASIDAKTTKIVFTSDESLNCNKNLLSYSYTESMRQIQGNFSLSAAYSEDLDKIEVHDVVTIREGVEGNRRTMFIGLVKNISHSKKMNDNGQVTSVINIAGSNIFGLISESKLVVDRAVIGNLCTSDAATKFQNALSESVDKDGDLSDVITAVINAFMALKEENMQGSEYYNGIINNISVQADKLKAKYPMALGYLGTQQCTLWQLISQIVPAPIYECFLAINETGSKYNLIVRENPFLQGTKVASSELDSLYLKGVDLHKKDNEVYSYYLAQITGAGLTKNIIQVEMDGSKEPGETADEDNAGKMQKDITNIDKDMMARFGYRPLIVECGFFDHTKTTDNAIEISRSITTALQNANKDNHKKLSGTIDALHDGKRWNVGTVVKCENKEFYIEEIENRWSYGQAHTRRFYVTRGGNAVNQGC